MKTTLIVLLISCICWAIPLAEAQADLTVSGVVTADGSPCPNVTLDVFPYSMYQVSVTDAEGAYAFIVPVGITEVWVRLATPYGYENISPSSESVTVSLSGADVNDVDFEISWAGVDPGQVRGLGYWRHQIAALDHGRGNPQESIADFDVWWSWSGVGSLWAPQPHDLRVSSLFGHSYIGDFQHLVAFFQEYDRNPGSWGWSIWSRAKVHAACLFLNVISFRLQQDEVVSADGGTVSQAMQQVSDQILDGDPSTDEAAKDLAEAISNGRQVAAGVIDINAYDTILYGAPGGLVRPSPAVGGFRVAPNPMVRSSTLHFDLASAGRAAVRVFDVTGRLMRTLLDEELPNGDHSTTWDGRSDLGEIVPNGVYFYRIDTPDGQLTARLVVMH
jgi:hypothetical protein